MTIHKIERPTIPDMQAVRQHVEGQLDDLQAMLETMQLIHHIDQDLLRSATHDLASLRKTLLLSMK